MSANIATEYRRLLRFYPPLWSDNHGEVVLGIYLDAAEAEGRDKLTLSEKSGIVSRGLATRVSQSRLTEFTLPAAGVLFAVLWCFAQVGHTYATGSPTFICVTLSLLGVALGLARLIPATSLTLASVILVAELIYGPIRPTDTSWPAALSALAIITAAVTSHRHVSIRRAGAVFGVGAAAVTAALLTLDLPSLGPAPAAPFPAAVVGDFAYLGPEGPAVIVLVAWSLTLVTFAVSWSVGRVVWMLAPYPRWGYALERRR